MAKSNHGCWKQAIVAIAWRKTKREKEETGCLLFPRNSALHSGAATAEKNAAVMRERERERNVPINQSANNGSHILFEVEFVLPRQSSSSTVDDISVLGGVYFWRILPHTFLFIMVQVYIFQMLYKHVFTSVRRVCVYVRVPIKTMAFRFASNWLWSKVCVCVLAALSSSPHHLNSGTNATKEAYVVEILKNSYLFGQKEKEDELIMVEQFHRILVFHWLCFDQICIADFWFEELDYHSHSVEVFSRLQTHSHKYHKSKAIGIESERLRISWNGFWL